MAAANAGEINHAQPGPIDTSVLTLQPNHRSEAIWNGQVKHTTKDFTFFVCGEFRFLNLDFSLVLIK